MFFTVTPDLCNNGELFSYIVLGNSIKALPEDIARKIIKGICEGVACLHQHNIFHRDLKLENICMNANFTPKIIDFGLSKKTSK